MTEPLKVKGTEAGLEAETEQEKDLLVEIETVTRVEIKEEIEVVIVMPAEVREIVQPN